MFLPMLSLAVFGAVRHWRSRHDPATAGILTPLYEPYALFRSLFIGLEG
jgi:hypothetical protein